MATDPLLKRWAVQFLSKNSLQEASQRRALIILNQPFSQELLYRVWNACQWRCCADGGANRLYDALEGGIECKNDGSTTKLGRTDFVPNLIKGDLDSLRPSIGEYYKALGALVVKDPDLYATDLMKCISAIEEMEKSSPEEDKYTIIFLGGLSGRLDQTVHTLSYLHKLRKHRKRVFVVTDDNVGWVLDQGEHIIEIDRSLVGATCGLLPVGVDSSILTTKGLRWNLTNTVSSFDGLVSSSNEVVDNEVYISTSKPIWWCIELAF